MRIKSLGHQNLNYIFVIGSVLIQTVLVQYYRIQSNLLAGC